MHAILTLVFIAALVLKLLHLPYHTVLLLAVAAIGIGTSLSGLRSERKSEAWCRLAFWTWLLHLVALLKLFPFRTATLVLAVAITVVAVFMAFRHRPLTNALRPLAGAFIAVMLVMAVPTATRFHFTNLRFSLERDTDPGTWDKYSFFLSREGRKTEALAANDAAHAAAAGDAPAIQDLMERRTLIEQDAWDRYVPLDQGQ